MKCAIGLIETKGYIGSIVAVDTALKAADVSLVSQEKSTGGMMTVCFTGDTAAIQSAVEAGAVAAEQVGELISAHVIPRIGDGIDTLIQCGSKSAVRNKSEEPKEADIQEDKYKVIFNGKHYTVFGNQGIETLKVTELRRLARELKVETIERSNIKYGNKKELLQAIREHIKGGS